MYSRTCLADAQHQAGRLSQAKDMFQKAEELQQAREPLRPLLYSGFGLRHYDLLLDQRKYDEVQGRISKVMIWAREVSRRAEALGYLSLGQAYLLQAQLENTGDYIQAAEFLDRAVDGIRQAGHSDELLRGLLARTACSRLRGAIGEADGYDWARADLGEAFALAARGEMRLHEADCHLESARLSLATGDRAMARKAWKQAKEMIEEMGYHRRDGDVAEIEAQLNAAGK
jgi:tetratricopeptide (TPR) repeat protein